MARNYKKEAQYEDTPEQVRNRVARNAARRKLMKAGKVSKGDGKDVDHKKALSKGGATTRSNLQVKSATANRSYARKSDHSIK
jgi:hypothetical protein